MENDYEVYIDPEEDEVFFGCITEKEKSICAKLSNPAGLNTKEDDWELNKHVKLEGCDELNTDDKKPRTGSNTPEGGDWELRKHVTDQGYSDLNAVDDKSVRKDIKKEPDDNCCVSVKTEVTESSHVGGQTLLNQKPHKTEKEEECGSVYSNTSVDLDHNYSTPMKQKIDKSILATPKSIVKADKDGGFLKVLSEIALVKAEAEGDKKLDEVKREDEDKENKIFNVIPDIRITEPSPEKTYVMSPPKSVNKKLRRFRIIYNSPNTENVSKRSVKSGTDNFEGCRNIKNRSLDQEFDPPEIKMMEEGEKNSGLGNQSVNLIDFDQSCVTDGDVGKQIEDDVFEVVNKSLGLKNNDIIVKDEPEALIAVKNEVDDEPVKMDAVTVKEEVLIKKDFDPNVINGSLNSMIKVEDECRGDVVDVAKTPGLSNLINEFCDKSEPPTNPPVKSMKEMLEEFRTFQSNRETLSTSKSDTSLTQNQTKVVKGCRFSKEARKIVDILKNTTINDTLNFTIQEIDVNEVENSFVSPEPMPGFDDTLVPKLDLNVLKPVTEANKISENVLTKRVENPKVKGSRTVEKELHKPAPLLSHSKIPPAKCFSDRRVYQQNGSNVKKCVKKLPMDEKRPATTEEKVKGSQMVEKSSGSVASSRIPRFDTKPSKIPLGGRVAHPATTKVTPSKTPTRFVYRNPKFNNIESPINAYINNKSTPLVLNVKPEVKKDCLAKVWKNQMVTSAKKIPEKTTQVQSRSNTAGLPFVEYRSGTPYQVEKSSESRLPRLAPTVRKLIGSHSPRILKHEGRFYVKTPRKPISTNDSTVLAEPNDVSVVVSQVAQKSNTIKQSLRDFTPPHHENAPIKRKNKGNKQTEEGKEKGVFGK